MVGGVYVLRGLQCSWFSKNAKPPALHNNEKREECSANGMEFQIMSGVGLGAESGFKWVQGSKSAVH